MQPSSIRTTSPSLQLLRRDAAVRERRVLAEADGDVGLCAPSARYAARMLLPQIALRHPLAQRGERRLVGGDRDVVGALHQRDLGWRLDHPAAGGDRIGADVVERRRLLLHAVEDEEAERAPRRRRGRSRRRGPSESARRGGTGLSSSCQCARPCTELDQLARARLLEAGQTQASSPFAGITATNGRSLRPQRTPVK